MSFARSTLGFIDLATYDEPFTPTPNYVQSMTTNQKPRNFTKYGIVRSPVIQLNTVNISEKHHKQKIVHPPLVDGFTHFETSNNAQFLVLVVVANKRCDFANLQKLAGYWLHLSY